MAQKGGTSSSRSQIVEQYSCTQVRHYLSIFGKYSSCHGLYNAKWRAKARAGKKGDAHRRLDGNSGIGIIYHTNRKAFNLLIALEILASASSRLARSLLVQLCSLGTQSMKAYERHTIDLGEVGLGWSGGIVHWQGSGRYEAKTSEL